MNSNPKLSNNPTGMFKNMVPEFPPHPKLRPINTESSHQVNRTFTDASRLLSPDEIKEIFTKILKFLKSDGKELAFPTITAKSEIFLVNLLKDYTNFKFKDFNSSILDVGKEILNVLEANKLNYKLVQNYESGRSIKTELIFKKQFYSGIKQNVVSAKKSSSRTLSPKTRAFKTENNNNIETDVTSSFKINWLNATIKFLKDGSRNELEYQGMTMQEWKFVRNLILPDNQKGEVGFGFKSMYSGLWDVLKEFKVTNDLGIAIKNSGNPMKTFLTLMKLPKKLKREKRIPTVKFRKTPKEEHSKPTPIKPGTSRASESRNNSVIKFTSAGPVATASKTIDQPVKCKNEVDQGTERMDVVDAGAARTKNIPKRNAKMIKDMSVPLESDIGIRMMLLMGWNGGALGTRGEGITEPIMPALDLSKGAGLGHVQPTIRTKQYLRWDFHQHLLSFVTSEERVKVVEYTNPPLGKGEVKYVNSSIEYTNQRKFLPCQMADINDIIAVIIKRMTSKPDLLIQCSISQPICDKITLSKTLRRLSPRQNLFRNSLNNQTEQNLQNENHPVVLSADVIMRICESIGTEALISKSKIGKKKIQTQRFRTAFLVKTLEFLKDNVKSRPYEYFKVLNLKMQEFMIKTVNAFNVGTRTDDLNEIEGMLFDEILQQMQSTVQFYLCLRIHSNLSDYKLEKCNVEQCYEQNKQRLCLPDIPTKPVMVEKDAIRDIYISMAEAVCVNDCDGKGLLARSIDTYNNEANKNNKDSVKRINISEEATISSYKNDSISIAPEKNNATTRVTNVSCDGTMYAKKQIAGSTIKVPINRQVTNIQSDNISAHGTIAAKNLSDGINNETCPTQQANSSKNNEGINDSIIQASCNCADSNKHMNSDPDTTTVDNAGSFDKEDKVLSDINNTIEIASKMDNSDRTSNPMTPARRENTNDCIELFQSVLHIDIKASDPNHSDTHTNVENSKPLNETIERTEQNTTEIDLSAIEMIEDDLTDDESYIFSGADPNHSETHTNVENSKPLNETIERTEQNTTEIDLSAIEMIEDDLIDDESYIFSGDSSKKSSNKEVDLSVRSKEEYFKDIKDLEKVIVDSDVSLQGKKECDDTSTSKRSRNYIELKTEPKKAKPNVFDKFKHVSIVPVDYPIEKIDNVKAQIIQDLICKNFDSVEIVLPRLKCLGIKDGGLVFCCHTEITYFWLENVINVASGQLKFKMIDYSEDTEDEFHVVALRIRSFIRDSCDIIFKRIKKYNKRLETDRWLVLEETRKNDILVIKIEIDSDSFEYISKENFCLYAGIDQAQFSYIF